MRFLRGFPTRDRNTASNSSTNSAPEKIEAFSEPEIFGNEKVSFCLPCDIIKQAVYEIASMTPPMRDSPELRTTEADHWYFGYSYDFDPKSILIPMMCFRWRNSCRLATTNSICRSPTRVNRVEWIRNSPRMAPTRFKWHLNQSEWKTDDITSHSRKFSRRVYLPDDSSAAAVRCLIVGLDLWSTVVS